MKPKKSTVPRSYDSMSQAAGALGIPVAMVSAMKRAGCMAFRGGGRVDRKELEQWMTGHPDFLKTALPAEANIRDKKLFEEWRGKKLANDKKDNLLVEKAKVRESITRFNTRVDALCSQKENEWPSLLAGLEAPQIRAYLKKGFDQVRSEVSESYREWIV